MTKRKTNQKSRSTKPLIKEVSKFSGDRLHVEIPSKRKQDFRPGDYVEVKNISNRDAPKE